MVNDIVLTVSVTYQWQMTFFNYLKIRSKLIHFLSYDIFICVSFCVKISLKERGVCVTNAIFNFANGVMELSTNSFP